MTVLIVFEIGHRKLIFFGPMILERGLSASGMSALYRCVCIMQAYLSYWSPEL